MHWRYFLWLLIAASALQLACGGGAATPKNAPASSTAGQLSVCLSWDASTSPVVVYNVYRGTQSGGPYQRLNPSPQPDNSYTDATVQSGLTYFYVATAVGTDLVESRHSNETSATIP